MGRKSMLNERGVSPVIGTILLIAVTVIVAGVIAAFAMGLGKPKATPAASIYFDNVENGASGFYIYHDGGDALENKNLDLRIDGDPTSWSLTTNDGDEKFEVGERITVDHKIYSDDRIVLIHAPTDSVLQETTVP